MWSLNLWSWLAPMLALVLKRQCIWYGAVLRNSCSLVGVNRKARPQRSVSSSVTFSPAVISYRNSDQGPLIIWESSSSVGECPSVDTRTGLFPIRSRLRWQVGVWRQGCPYVSFQCRHNTTEICQNARWLGIDVKRVLYFTLSHRNWPSNRHRLQVNHLATSLLALLLLPHLIKSSTGADSQASVSRLIIVSSEAHYLFKPNLLKEAQHWPNLLQKLNSEDSCTFL